ncbi:MAG: alpha/beta hydrolase [Cytophagaceae bacterium]|nr:alpha/beta hydrolase [Cytophagaceae bacterium]
MYLELKTIANDDRPVYLTGDFCNWNPRDERFLMRKVGEGKYKLDLEKNFTFDQPLQYKYTKGGWEHVELDIFGNTSKNRTLLPVFEPNIDIVPLWRKNGFTPFFSELMPLIEEFKVEIPQLKRQRHVSVILPSDYLINLEKKYPVVYMHDAQNLFGEGSVYGNWEIDKRLSLLKKQGKSDVIIVAINHGEEDRQVEFSPYKNQVKGQGMRYATFIVRTLKSLIDKKYRTLSERQYTGIGGSSMGGLISIYTGMMYPEAIGRLMVFSPSLWTSPKIYFDAVEFFNPLDTKIYLYGGGKESESMLPNIEKLKETIEGQGFESNKIQIKAELDPEGQHNEKRWGQEFPKALDWLFC